MPRLRQTLELYKNLINRMIQRAHRALPTITPFTKHHGIHPGNTAQSATVEMTFAREQMKRGDIISFMFFLPFPLKPAKALRF